MQVLTNEQLTKLVIELGQRLTELESKQPKSRFKKPTLQEVAHYMYEKGCQGYLEQSQRFVDYYESNGWKVGKNPMKSWKGAVNNWLNNNYSKPNKENREGVSKALRNIQDTDW